MIVFDKKHLLDAIALELQHESDLIANFANISSMIFHSYEDLSWVGFYLAKDDELILGPFQGKPACSRIKKGKGVCGEAFLYNKVIIVDDCLTYPNHIACDVDSKSEIVLPVIYDERIIAVLDIDSTSYNRFQDQELVASLYEIVSKINSSLKEKNRL